MSCGRRRHLQAEDFLFRHGDPHEGVYLVESGLVRTYYGAASGREITLAYWPAGNLVGLPQVWGGGTYAWSGVAVQTSDILAIRGEDLRALVERIPALAVSVVEAMAFKVQWLSALVQMLGTQSVTQRIAQLLDTLSKLYGVPDAGGVAIGTPFSHEELASMVGASRQWVTTTLDRLQERGIVRIHKRRIVILHQDLLRSLAS